MKALLVEKDEDGKTHASVQQIEEDRLPEGDVTVAVEYSTLNYKDGLTLGPGGGLVKTYPHVPGIDFAGTVESSDHDCYKPGDQVVLTGWRVGEAHWGGYAEKARVKAEWLVPLPDGLTTRQAMSVGTAGFTAMLAVMALEDHGLTPDAPEPVLVTGASGGVRRFHGRHGKGRRRGDREVARDAQRLARQRRQVGRRSQQGACVPKRSLHAVRLGRR